MKRKLSKKQFFKIIIKYLLTTLTCEISLSYYSCAKCKATVDIETGWSKFKKKSKLLRKLIPTIILYIDIIPYRQAYILLCKKLRCKKFTFVTRVYWHCCNLVVTVYFYCAAADNNFAAWPCKSRFKQQSQQYFYASLWNNHLKNANTREE